MTVCVCVMTADRGLQKVWLITDNVFAVYGMHRPVLFGTEWDTYTPTEGLEHSLSEMRDAVSSFEGLGWTAGEVRDFPNTVLAYTADGRIDPEPSFNAMDPAILVNLADSWLEKKRSRRAVR